MTEGLPTPPTHLPSSATDAGSAPLPRTDRRPEVVASFLSDAAHVPGGHSPLVAFPRTADEVSAVISRHDRILAVGAQSSLTGGATPRGDVVLSTRSLDTVQLTQDALVSVGAGVPLASLQHYLRDRGLYYPPVPTYDGATVGGTVSTNAAGPATFKYGTTRRWVEAMTIVLGDGSVLCLRRGDVRAGADNRLRVPVPSGTGAVIPVPRYRMPGVPKLSAGYFAEPGMDLIDLFVGSEGTLGIVVDATLRVAPLPVTATALVSCPSDAEAVALSRRLREEAQRAWSGNGPLDVAAIEYMDARALSTVDEHLFAAAGVQRPAGDAVLLLAQFEVAAGEEDALGRFEELLGQCGISGDVQVALPGDRRGAARMFELREAVPASVNRRIAAVKARVDPAIHKTAGDMIVPFERLADSLALYRRLFTEYDLPYAIWGHVSDGNLHPNVLPESIEQMERGQAAIVDIAREVIAMGGAPLAEHGVGRGALKQRLLRELYGEAGIDDMRAVKRALDPAWKLASGVLFAER